MIRSWRPPISYSRMKETLLQLDAYQLACILVDCLFQYPEIMEPIDKVTRLQRGKEGEELEEVVQEISRKMGKAQVGNEKYHSLSYEEYHWEL